MDMDHQRQNMYISKKLCCKTSDLTNRKGGERKRDFFCTNQCQKEHRKSMQKTEEEREQQVPFGLRTRQLVGWSQETY